MSLPGTFKKKWFFQKRWAPDLFETFGGLLAIVPVAILAWKTYYSTDTNVGGLDRGMAIAAVIGVAFITTKGGIKLYQNYVAEKVAIEMDQVEGIEAGLEIIHSIVRHMHDFDRHQRNRLRITLYRVADSLTKKGEKDLEQIVEYVGGGDNVPRKGRRFSMRCGLIGKVARSGEARAVSREHGDFETYLRELEVEWNFTHEEALNISRDRNSFFGVPITFNGEVTAVVYMDSSERNFFPDNVKRQVIVACLGLAVFINRRYYNG